MKETLQSMDWETVLNTIWSIVLLPLLTYVWSQIQKWAKEKKVDKYTEILKDAACTAVKDVYQTVVQDIKGTTEWTDEKKQEIKEMAKLKAIHALSNSAYELLKKANTDFEEYLDSLIESSLFDIKNKLKEE